MSRLLRHLVRFKIALRRNSESICNAIEKCEHRCNIDSLGNLRIGPSVIAQVLDIFCGRAIRSLSHLCHVFQQRALCRAQFRFIEVAVGQRLHRLFFCSLNTQEVSM